MDRPQSRWLPPLAPQPVPEPSLPASPPPRRTGLRRFTGPLFVGLLALLKWGKAALLLLPKAKVLTTWVRSPKLALRQRWTFEGKQRTLANGRYKAYVWAALGTPATSVQWAMASMSSHSATTCAGWSSRAGW